MNKKSLKVTIMANLTLNTREIAKVNNVAIMAGNDPKQLVPIKPICDVLGIDAKAQRNRIDRDEILSSTGVIMTSVAADGKEREMYCIPLRYVFGWLFSIDTNRVDEEARPSVIKYKMQCYDVLYDHFSSYASFVNQKQKRQAEDWARIQILKKEFHEAKNKLAKATKQMNMTVDYSFEQWKANGKQLILDFDD
nr:MAG: hypothetical protein [Bacteriophage sp.]